MFCKDFHSKPFAITFDKTFGTLIHDTKGGIPTVKRAYERYLSIQKFYADAGYQGTFVSDLSEQFDLDVDISEKSSSTYGKNSLGDGRLNTPSLGSIIPDNAVKTMRFPALPLRL